MDVTRINTILYCEAWAETVRFYRELVGLGVFYESDWFVEFEVGPGFLSIADAARATVGESRGQGITLSWEVPDIHSARYELETRGVPMGPIGRRWGALIVDFWDPEGHRIELWQEQTEVSQSNQAGRATNPLRCA